MFTFPDPGVLSAPVFSFLDGGAVLWPSIGAVLAWMLVAAFVGTSLGLLREALRGTQRRPAEKAAAPQIARVAPAHDCCEAA